MCPNHYYVYVIDPDWGPAFIKICGYAPYPVKICLNGHEWAKRQLQRRRIRFTALDNGFLSCAKPDVLQTICQTRSEADIEAFFTRWQAQIPFPLLPIHQARGFSYQLSLLQLEVSLTQVFDRPLRGREFFESVIRENLDLGRPDQVQLLFPRKITRATPGRFTTRVITDGVNPSLHIAYKRCHIKQYFKEERALRTETTFNDTYDFGIGRRLSNLSYLRTLGDHINRRVLETERVAHDCGLAPAQLAELVQPTQTPDGQPAPALKFGQPRVTALLNALCHFLWTADGLTNAQLRPLVASLVGTPYTTRQMGYDLRRLTRKGLNPVVSTRLVRRSDATICLVMRRSWPRIITNATVNRVEKNRLCNSKNESRMDVCVVAAARDVPLLVEIQCGGSGHLSPQTADDRLNRLHGSSRPGRLTQPFSVHLGSLRAGLAIRTQDAPAESRPAHLNVTPARTPLNASV